MDQLLNAGTTRVNGSAGLAAGTTTTLTIANAIDFAIAGKAYLKAAASNIATPTTDVVTGAAFVAVPVGYCCAFNIMLDSSGALKVSQGKKQALDADNNIIVAPLSPATPADLCRIGGLVIKVGSTGAAWTFGSSNLAGPPTGVTVTFINGDMPDRPKTS